MRIILSAAMIAALTGLTALAADAKAGQAIYEKSCKSCHGLDGTPNPAMAKMFKVEMRDLKSAEVQAMSSDDMKKIISEGKGKMKPVKAVTGADLDNVAAYVHGWKK